MHQATITGWLFNFNSVNYYASKWICFISNLWIDFSFVKCFYIWINVAWHQLIGKLFIYCGSDQPTKTIEYRTSSTDRHCLTNKIIEIFLFWFGEFRIQKSTFNSWHWLIGEHCHLYQQISSAWILAKLTKQIDFVALFPLCIVDAEIIGIYLISCQNSKWLFKIIITMVHCF